MHAIDKNKDAYSVQAPAKPVKKSDIGYVTVLTDDVRIQPASSRVFIVSQSELPLIEELKDSYIFIYPALTGSCLCKVPKLQRYTTLFVVYSDTKTAYFRGSMEAETMPLTFIRGEELPVSGELEKSYLVEVFRNSAFFTFTLSKDEKGISFNKQSAFDLFAAEQKKKGIVFYENKWIPETRAKVLEDAKLEAIRLEEARMENVKLAASQGYILLVNNQLLKGRLKGAASDSILWDIDGQERWIPLTEISDAKYTAVIERGLRVDAQSFYDKALSRFNNGDFGETLRYLEAASRILDGKIKNNDAVSSEISSKVKTLYSELNNALDKNAQAVYNYHVFLKTDLTYHLERRHILFNNSIWIKPPQLCSDCKGAGLVNCKQCGALGYVQRICEHCQNGMIICPVCGGEGRRVCPDCNGTGSIVRKCKTCMGRGLVTVSGMRYYPYYNPGGFAITNGGVNVISVGPSCYYPPVIFNSYTEQQTCPECNGKGETDRTCKRCNGAGKINCPKFIRCTFCEGKGVLKIICSACQGKKQVKCAACEGHGFTGEPQKSPSDPDFNAQAPLQYTPPLGGPAREKIVLP